MKGLFALVPLAVASAVSARTFTVKNNCAYTVWPGMFTDPNVGPARPDHPTGWEAAPGTEVSFNVPNDWKAGRIWASHSAEKNATSPPTLDPLLVSAVDVTGGLEEWTLQGDANLDYYDVSLVDGFNIPMAITNNVNCPVADCPVDLNANCPAELASAAGCASACFANLDGNQQDSANCCSGSHSTPDTCPPSGVQFYDFFKGACPNSYAYAYDESSNTALWTCDSSLNADYTLTFCP
uniref:Putative thaumatin-like protein n=1 Tax=Moniliophthora roreri TaxID=221103 RepID=A0A0W0EY42_MONRR